METRKRVLGEEHLDTIRSISHLSYTYRQQGRWAEAETLQVKLMETRKRVLGRDHPSTLSIMASLAETFQHQDRRKEAVELNEQLREIRRSFNTAQEEQEDMSTGRNSWNIPPRKRIKQNT